jgi:hypothetical protein
MWACSRCRHRSKIRPQTFSLTLTDWIFSHEKRFRPMPAWVLGEKIEQQNSHTNNKPSIRRKQQ